MTLWNLSSRAISRLVTDNVSSRDKQPKLRKYVILLLGPRGGARSRFFESVRIPWLLVRDYVMV